ncbi:hypothetical protein [Bosea sp. NPDC055594]
MSTISLTDGISLPETFEDLPRIGTSIVDSNTLAALYSDASPQWCKVEEEWKVVPDPSGNALIILFDRRGETRILPKFRIQSAWIVFAVKPDECWVVARTSRNIGSGELRDTTVYDSAGAVINLVEAGGAVAFIQLSENGSFWIGHDDEDASDDAKLGGVSYFTADGSEVFHQDCVARPDTPENDGMPFWCCYALNVIGRSAWTQHYTSMLITRFNPDGGASSWATENNGAVALALRDGIVARVGRYDEDQYRISAFRLKEPPRSEFIGRVAFDIEGQTPKYQPWIDGKGDTFHLVHDNKWYRLTLDEVLSRLEGGSAAV